MGWLVVHIVSIEPETIVMPCDFTAVQLAYISDNRLFFFRQPIANTNPSTHLYHSSLPAAVGGRLVILGLTLRRALHAIADDVLRTTI